MEGHQILPRFQSELGYSSISNPDLALYSRVYTVWKSHNLNLILECRNKCYIAFNFLYTEQMV